MLIITIILLLILFILIMIDYLVLDLLSNFLFYVELFVGGIFLYLALYIIFGCIFSKKIRTDTKEGITELSDILSKYISKRTQKVLLSIIIATTTGLTLYHICNYFSLENSAKRYFLDQNVGCNDNNSEFETIYEDKDLILLEVKKKDYGSSRELVVYYNDDLESYCYFVNEHDASYNDIIKKAQDVSTSSKDVEQFHKDMKNKFLKDY